MALVMFEVIAFGCQGGVVLVLNFPAGASGRHDGLHGRVIEMLVCHKRSMIQAGAVRFFGDGECTPIDPPRIFTLAHGDGGGIPRRVDGVKPPLPAADGALLERPRGLDPREPLLPRGVRLRRADQDTVEAVPQPEVATGWVTVESVTEEGDRLLPCCLACTPPLGGELLTILLRMAIWGCDARWLHGDALVSARGDHDGGNRWVTIGPPSSGVGALGTVRPRDLL